ncbi:MAG: Glutamate-pyruvate aminotransferase AlaC [Bacteroidetes bacterium ADurb.Bin302]|jgi:aspartate/methionine/tyrosine aminotransferase|nr:MAG: Glutamate-pyruvate aminotransferase AlaC [Bacteroidetes bacterium ADurb.Bin302]
MQQTPFDYSIVKSVIDSFHLPDFSKATIREIVNMALQIEKQTGKRFARMEMGIPGIPAPEIGVEAEIEALKNGVASTYPLLSGIPELKNESSRFIKAFIDVDINPECCVPAVGSMNGAYASFLMAGQCDEKKDTILFIDPGFPVQKMQIQVLGYKIASFDVYDYRGDKMKDKIESYLSHGNIAAIVYSNPNNPSWVCLTNKELKIIGELSEKYDTIVIEDLAYFAMDFRKNIGTPFKAPFQASVAKYTKNYILLISGSKAFSYAGQRIGIIAMSDYLYSKKYTALKKRYGVDEFGNVLISRVLYSLSAGVTHSTQYAMAAMMKAANDGKFDFISQLKIYGKRARILKKLFLENGFHIVYDKDLEEDIADGFYFTVAYSNLKGTELMYELLFYGISAIALNTTGSNQEGLRICTSFVDESQYNDIEERLKVFNFNHK